MRFVIAIALLVALCAAGARAGDDPGALGPDDTLRLNPTITVTDDNIHLGDIFTGYLSRPEKVVAQAPRPGQRVILSADWLTNLAHTYGLEWHPLNTYDRAIVYRAGKTISADAILAAIKTALRDKGLPVNYGLMPASALASVTIAAALPDGIDVREAYYDSTAHTFSAVVEIPPGDPKAQFIPVQGKTFPVIAVPVLKDDAPRYKVITAEMLTTLNMREDEVKRAMITDTAALLGKATKLFLRAGQPLFDDDVAMLNIIDVPVLKVDLSHDTPITADEVTTATFNAAELPRDAVMDASDLVGKSPRHYLAAGAPVRTSDIQLVHKIQVPVVRRDVGYDAKLTASDLSWVTADDTDVTTNVLLSANDIVGRATKHAMRAGQMFHAYDIARPIAVEQGKVVTIVYSLPMLNLTVQGLAQESGGIGDVIRIANSKSNAVVLAEVVDSHTVRVASRPTPNLQASAR